MWQKGALLVTVLKGLFSLGKAENLRRILRGDGRTMEKKTPGREKGPSRRKRGAAPHLVAGKVGTTRKYYTPMSRGRGGDLLGGEHSD